MVKKNERNCFLACTGTHLLLLLLLLVVQERLNYVQRGRGGGGKIVLTFLGSHFTSKFSALFQYKFILLADLAIYTTVLKRKDTSYILYRNFYQVIHVVFHSLRVQKVPVSDHENDSRERRVFVVFLNLSRRKAGQLLPHFH